jgi:hypothetical protein
MTDPSNREPLLSDADILEIIGAGWVVGDEMTDEDEAKADAGEKIRDFYEDLIAKGELTKSKPSIPRGEAKEHVLNCAENMYEAMDTYFYNYILFCPGCGAKIIE